VRILVVDDDPDLLEITAECLQQSGHEIVSAESVAAAKVSLANETFDIVVTDYNMPGGGGGELVRFVKERSKNNATSTGVVVVSGELTLEDPELKSVWVTTLAKPFSTPDLVVACARLKEKLKDKVQAS
jgi:DNA-binding NtrC family response regulator